MRSVPTTTGAVFFMVVLAAFCAAAQQPAQTAALPDSGYVLGPDDQIVIHAMESPEISDKPILIGTNGNITLPLVGRVKAGGLTVEQLETELNARLKKYVKDPQISVTVVEFRSQPVSVFGAVTKPGVIQLRGRKTLYEVLSMAGGPRETAGSTLTVTRRRENGEIPLPGATIDPTGQFSTARLNVQEILEGKNPAANIEIKPNDTISVSEADSNMIYVVGDVEHGGAFTLGGRQSFPCSGRCPSRVDSDARRSPRRRGSFAVLRGRRSPWRSPSTSGRYLTERQRISCCCPKTSSSFPPAAVRLLRPTLFPRWCPPPFTLRSTVSKLSVVSGQWSLATDN